MLQINCTKKLIKILEVPQGGSCSNIDCSKNLGVWFANVFEVEFDPYLSIEYPHSYLLLVNDESLLSFYVRIPDEFSYELLLEGLPQFFRNCFIENKFTEKQTRFLQAAYREIYLSEAKNKSMLGYLRSYAMNYADQIRRNYHERFAGQEDFNFDLNGMERPNLIRPTPARSAKYIVSQAMRRAT